MGVKKGFKWDVGVHYIGRMGEDEGLKFFFDYLANDNLDWDFIGDTYDVANIDGHIYEFKAGKENFINKMNEYFPEEKKAINKYLKLVNESNKRTNLFFVQKVFVYWFRLVISGVSVNPIGFGRYPALFRDGYVP